MAQAKMYEFNDCECKITTGRSTKIPDGIWPVTELDIVSVMVGGEVYSLYKNEFTSLKIDRKVIPILNN